MIRIFKHKKTVIILLGIICIIMPTNEVYCSNAEPTNNTQELQTLVREFLNDLDENEVDEFGRELIRLRQINPPQGWPLETNTEPQPNKSVWTPVVIYVLLSTAIVLISLYHQEIINTFFNVTQDIITEILPSAINGLIPRDIVNRLTMHLLQNPENHERVVALMTRMREVRRMAQGV